MESFYLMLWIFVVPLHAFVLQPSAHVVALEDSGSERAPWYEGGKESTGGPLTLAEDRHTNGEGGADPEGSRTEAREVGREELHDANGGDPADEEERKRHKEEDREGKMEEHRNEDEEKEGMQRITDVEEERELTADLAEEEDQRQEESQLEDDIFGEGNRNLEEYRAEDDMEEMLRNYSLSIDTDIPHLNPNLNLSIATDIPHLSPNTGLSIETDIPHLNPNLDLSIGTDIPHLSPDTGLSIDTDIPHLSPNTGLSIETDIPHLSPTPRPSHNDQNSSEPDQEQDHLQTLLTTADSTLTPTIRQGPVRAGESEEAFTRVKPNSKLVQLTNLTDGSQPHLREEEGLVPKAIEVKLDPFWDLPNRNSVTQDQKKSEKKRSKFNRPMPKPKKKKTHPAKKTEKTQSKQKSKAEKKSKSLKKDKNIKNKKKKQKENKKVEKETIPHFPYFTDDYCPPACACYGRVVQCSDKVLDKIPYGIPFDARYVLLMNNQIPGIQLDLLREYLSLEFLVLSNNLLRDEGIEGAFEGMRQLKRLYLDLNHLNSIPTDLPLSLEELRLDGNNVSVMSEVAWAHSPSLQILSLNNNTLGAESLPDGVFAPMSRLRTLSLVHNLLTAVPVHLPANIKELYLRGNHIDRVPGEAFAEGSDLLVLDLSVNRLTDKGLTKDSLKPLVHLENLNLEGNLLRNIPKHLPTALRTLNLEGNAITSVSKEAFLGLPHLEHLGLSRNLIAKVAPGAFWGLPALHQLELGHNVLRQVPRRLPRSLHSVSLVHNKIRSVPRDSFCAKGEDSPLSNLVRVHLEHNLIHLADLDTQAFNCLRGYQVIHFY